MPKSTTDRAPRGTNIVYKAITEALAGYPAENHKAIAKAVWAKLKENLPSARAPSARKRVVRKAAAKRRAPRRHLNGATSTEHQIAA